jgi:hypothetical protein
METRQIKGHLRQFFLLLSCMRAHQREMCSLFSLGNGAVADDFILLFAGEPAADDARIPYIIFIDS